MKKEIKSNIIKNPRSSAAIGIFKPQKLRVSDGPSRMQGAFSRPQTGQTNVAAELRGCQESSILEHTQEFYREFLMFQPSLSIKGKFPKVLVGAPVYSGKDYITPAWVQSLKAIDYPNYDILAVDNSREKSILKKIFNSYSIKVIPSRYYKNPIKRLTLARQKLYNYALKKGYEYLMSVEQDIIVPDNIIKNLIDHRKQIVGAPYAIASHTNKERRRVDYIISASKFGKILGKADGVEINEWYLLRELANCKGLLLVKSCAFGCTLIHAGVLKIVKARYNPRINRSDDSYFFQDCKNLGIRAYLDTSLMGKIKHVKNIMEDLSIGGEI